MTELDSTLKGALDQVRPEEWKKYHGKGRTDVF